MRVRPLSWNYSWSLNNVGSAGVGALNPHTVENPQITFDSTMGPPHSWIQPSLDWKQYFWSEVENLFLGSFSWEWENHGFNFWLVKSVDTKPMDTKRLTVYCKKSTYKWTHAVKPVLSWVNYSGLIRRGRGRLFSLLHVRTQREGKSERELPL